MLSLINLFNFFLTLTFINSYHNGLTSSQLLNFHLDFTKAFLLSLVRQHTVSFSNASLKAPFILPQKPFVLYFSKRNIWGLIKTIKNAVKRSLGKTPAAFITEDCFPQSPKELSVCGNECVMCFMEWWCWISAKVWRFSSTQLRNVYFRQSEKCHTQGNQAALQFLNTLKISIQAPFASPLQSKIRGKRSWIEHRDNLSPPLLSCLKRAAGSLLSAARL